MTAIMNSFSVDDCLRVMMISSQDSCMAVLSVCSMCVWRVVSLSCVDGSAERNELSSAIY